MHGRLIDIDALGEHDLAAWRDLAREALEPNPFFEPEFALPAFRHLATPEVALLVVEDGDRWRACMPVAAGRWRGPLRAVRPWRHLYAFLGSPLVAADDSAGSLRALLQTAAGGPSGRLLALEWISADGPLAAALAQALEGSGLARAGEMPFERGAFSRGEQGLLDLLPRKRRHELVRQRRRLEETLGGALECRNAAGDPDAVERFLRLEAEGWKGREGTALLALPSHAAFFREVCEAFAAVGRLDLFDLAGGGRTVAMKCNLHAAPGLFTFKIAYDVELQKFSPGVQLEVENVEKFHEGDLDWMDSCASPDNQMINRLWPERRAMTTLVLARGALRGRVSRLGLGVVRARRERRQSSTAT